MKKKTILNILKKSCFYFYARAAKKRNVIFQYRGFIPPHEVVTGWLGRNIRNTLKIIHRPLLMGHGGGFTMVEIVIMLAIITIISAIVLANFPSVSGNISVQKSAQRFGLTLRQVQNQALAVRVVQGPGGPVVPPAVGVNITTSNPTSYFTFADMNVNHIYDSSSDIIIENLALERNVAVYEILSESGGSVTDVNIVFTAPTGDASIYDAAFSVGQSALIRFRAGAGGLVRSVRVRTSGQIAIE